MNVDTSTYICKSMTTSPSISLIMNTTIPVIEVVDSFVYCCMKLSNGKNGHGERRLYTGNDNDVNNFIITKPWKIVYDPNYLVDFGDYLDNDGNFVKPMENRKERVQKDLEFCNGKLMHIRTQNGTKDVCRYYVGPDKTNKETVKIYDTLRKTVVPRQTCIELEEFPEYFVCNVMNNKNLERKRQWGTSKAAIECFKYKSRILNIEIQTKENGGEFALRNPKNGYFWPVDGYHNCSIHKCSGDKNSPCPYNNHVFEFQGDYFHGNETKYSGDTTFHHTTYSKKREKDLEKKHFYESQGHTVHIIWESEWTKEKKELKSKGLTW